MRNKHMAMMFYTLVYGLGVLMGLFLVTVGAWAGMESAFYGFPRLAEAGLGGFSCPILMTRNEAAAISLTLSNPTSQKISPAVKVEISTPALPEEFLETFELAPGETKKLDWRVDAENIDLERFIFAKFLLYSAYPLTSREATCGIFILDLPGSGRVLLPTLATLSLLAMGAGLYGVSRFGVGQAWESKNQRAMTFLSALLIVGFALNVWGRWMQALLVLAVILLSLIILLGPLFLSERRER
jgi:hypothetical protein